MGDPIKEVMEERGNEYGEAWAGTGEILNGYAEVTAGATNVLKTYAKAYFPWIMILDKWLRIMVTPKNPDHWLDIAGYAMLVHKDLTENK